jgi:hypothetical protein
MVSIVPNYVYSIFAAIIVGAILVYACSVSTLSIRSSADSCQLTNVDEYVAAQSLSLLSRTTQTNQTATQYLDLPSSIGNQRYWVHLSNDSSAAWVTSNFGLNITRNQPGVSIPANVAASGDFLSGSGRPFLQCSFASNNVTLTLKCE